MKTLLTIHPLDDPNWTNYWKLCKGTNHIGYLDKRTGNLWIWPSDASTLLYPEDLATIQGQMNIDLCNILNKAPDHTQYGADGMAMLHDIGLEP
jgi:hypothetical protein